MNDEKVKILLTYKIGGADFGSLDIFVGYSILIKIPFLERKISELQSGQAAIVFWDAAMWMIDL